MLDRLVTALGEGLVALDSDLRYVFMNEAAERLVGVTRDQVLGRRPEEVLPASVLEQAMPHMLAAHASGQPSTYDI